MCFNPGKMKKVVCFTGISGNLSKSFVDIPLYNAEMQNLIFLQAKKDRRLYN